MNIPKTGLQAATEKWQRWCRHDMVQQSVADVSGSDWKSPIADG